MSARRLHLLWAALMAATLLSGALGESGTPGPGTVLLVMALAVAKGVAIVLDFMELREAPALWRRLLLGWLWGVSALIVLGRLAA